MFMIKEFSSRAEMLQYEKLREEYYLESISSRWNIYKTMFLEIFHPKYRALKRRYDGYAGGYWIDDKGRFCANHVALIDTKRLKDGDICIEYNEYSGDISRLYVFKDGVFIMLSLAWSS